MNKRVLTIVAVVAAISMLSFAVFAGRDTYKGYESFKELLRNEQVDKDFEQGSASIKVIDNGETVLDITGEFAGNEENNEGYGNLLIKANGINKSLEIFGQEDTMYIVDGDDVYVGNHDEEEYDNGQGHFSKEKNEDKEFDAKSEMFLDFLVGDLKDNFELDGENIVFELNKEEMPAILNLMTSDNFDFKEDRQEEKSMAFEGYPIFEELKSLENIIPELNDTEFEYIKITLVIENGLVEGVKLNVIVTGVDESNEKHEIEVQAEFNHSDKPLEIKTFELTDETVYELKENR